MAFGYRYRLTRQENGWWLLCFPGIPEALTEGETPDEARANAVAIDKALAKMNAELPIDLPRPRMHRNAA